MGKKGSKDFDILSYQEFDKVISQIELEDECLMLKTLYEIGCRSEELRFLKIRNVYLKQNMIRLKGKNKKERVVPIDS